MTREEPVLPDQYRKEYAEFIDFAVHELDAPLRKLSVMIDRLRLGAAEPGNQEKYFPRIQHCVDDMRSAISALGTLSSISSFKPVVTTCNLNDILAELISGSPEWSGANIKYADLPVIGADAAALKLVLRNLLENAMKFVKGGEPAITITGGELPATEIPKFSLDRSTDYVQIVVKDRGIGFDNQDAGRIFDPFVRLNGKSDYPGNGIGLAICKKIINYQGGVIYASGSKNEGATFTLIIPKSDIEC